MKVRSVKRYVADCGRGFWKESDCAKHEINCKCWTNPKYKTCLTCKWAKKLNDGYDQWTECGNPLYDESKFRPAHIKAPDIAIDCHIWESKINPQPLN